MAFDSQDDPRLLPNSGLAGAVVVIGTGLAAFILQWVARVLWVPPSGVSTVWVPGAFLLAVALLTEPRHALKALAAGGVGVTAFFSISGLTSLGQAVVLGVFTWFTTAVVAAMLRTTLRSPWLRSLREFLIYLGVVVVGGAAVDASLYTAVIWGTAVRPLTFQQVRTAALSIALGYLIVTPAVVLLVRDFGNVRRDTARRWVEAAALFAALAFACSLAFADAPHRWLTWPALALLLPPLLLWAATRFGPLGATWSLLMIAVFSTYSTANGLGPFAGDSPAANTLSLQLFILGSGLPLLGLAIVIEEQRRTASDLRITHDRLTQLSRALIAARDEESARIARELHDDVGQQLALVSIGLSRLRRSDPSIRPPVEEVTRLQEQMGAAVRSVRTLSHELHPPALEHFGLAAALEMQCDDIRQVTGLHVHFANEVDGDALPRGPALCLFRVAQEALGNVMRHADAHRVDLALTLDSGVVRFQIRDDGRGMAVDASLRNGGLGLRSMDERVRMLGGTMSVESAPGAGTTLRVVLPVPAVGDA